MKSFDVEKGLITENNHFEVYRLYIDSIKGIDPCMTFQERI